jgi:hypothetical protein
MKVVGYEDYVDRLHAEFPEVNKKSINDVLKFGTGKMLYYKRLNIDLYIKDDVNLKFFLYIGDITTTAYNRNGIYFRKKRKKLRHMYSLDKEEYDGYFYFGLTDEQHARFKESNILDRVFYYKIKKEAHISPRVKYIYRVKMDDPHKWFIIKENYEEHKAEYIQSRNGREFADV